MAGKVCEPNKFVLSYAEILEGFLRTGDESFLLKSYDLGKEMLDSGVSTQFAADVHFTALEKVRRKISLGESPNTLHNPTIPFLELTMAFGLAFQDQLGALLRFTEILDQGKKEWEETFDAIMDPIFVHDLQGGILRANTAFRDLVGKPFKDIIGFTPWGLLSDQDTLLNDCPFNMAVSLLQKGECVGALSREMYVPKLGRHFLVSVTPLCNERNTPSGLICTMKDITTRIEKEEAERRFQQKLRKEIALAEERERRRIAQDIHDNLGQALAISKRQIQEIEGNLATGPDTPPTGLKEVASLLDEMIGQTRTLTFDLYPAILDDFGLISALEWYAEDFASKTGLRINLIKTGKLGKVSKITSIYLFRAAKEMLNNILKHAQAREVMVALHSSESNLRIVVDDDGQGFETDRVLTTADGFTGIGLASIRQWISDMNGRFSVESTPGQGTRIVVEAPVNR